MSKILIAEDEKDLRRLIALALSERRHEVLEAEDGWVALEKIYLTTPDILITDLQMPVLDGFELCRKVRRDKLLNFMPVIILTTLTEEKDQLKGINLGVEDYITKPFSMNVFIAKVENTIKRFSLVADLDPVTKLPGGSALTRQLSEKISSGAEFAFLFMRLQYLAEYGEYYGFGEEEKAESWLAGCLVDKIRGLGRVQDMVSKIDRGCFGLITGLESFERIAEGLVEEFNSQRASFYQREENRAGYIVLKSRQGETRKVPLLQLLISCTTTQNKKYYHFGELTGAIYEIDRKLASEGVSAFFVDKRNMF